MDDMYYNEFSNQDYATGKKLVTVAGIINIVGYALNILSALRKLDFLTLIVGAFMIFATVKCMQGGKGWRVFIIVMLSLSVTAYTLILFFAKAFLGLYFDVSGYNWIVTIIRVIMLFLMAVYGTALYLLAFNKKVKAYYNS